MSKRVGAATMLISALLCGAVLSLGAPSLSVWAAENEEKPAEEEAGRRVGEHHKQQAEKDYRIPEAGARDQQGRPLLSWRVKILRQLGYSNLYEAFHHDEPWNSEHNRQLIHKMPRTYQTAPTTQPGRTTIVALVSKRSAITSEAGGIRLSQVKDGASHTILFVRADPDHAVIWTKPEDIEFDPENPFRGLEDRGRFFDKCGGNLPAGDRDVQSRRGQVEKTSPSAAERRTTEQNIPQRNSQIARRE